MNRLLIPILLAVAVLSAPIVAQAADKAGAPKNEAQTKFRPFNGVIKSVDKSGKAIILQGAKAQTFQIISETKITKDGKPATLDDLADGDSVGGRARETADGKWEATTINAGKKAVGPGTPK